MRKHISLILAALFVLMTAGSALATDQGECSDCKHYTTGLLTVPNCSGVQGSSNTFNSWFDYGYDGIVASGSFGTAWCPSTTPSKGQFLLNACNCTEIVIGKSYNVVAKIKTPGVYFLGDNPSAAVYGARVPFTSSEVGVVFYNATQKDELCANATYRTFAGGNYNTGESVAENFEIYTSALKVATPFTSATIGGKNLCTDSLATQGQLLKSDPITITTFKHGLMMVDLPGYFYDPKVVTAGTEIVVQIGLVDDCGACGWKEPVCSCEQTVGVLGCATPGKTICFPYFTGLDETNWWNGLAVINPGKTAQDVKLTFTSEGVSVEKTVTLAGGSVYADLIPNIVGADGAKLTGRMFVQAEGESAIDGFAMMGDGQQGQGYLPRCGSCSAGCQ